MQTQAPSTRPGPLEGIVSLDDLVVALAVEVDELATVLEKQSPRL